jgi:DNA-binding NtrC family response regulator
LKSDVMTYLGSTRTQRIALLDGDTARRARLVACIDGDVVDSVTEGVDLIVIDASRVAAIVAQHPEMIVLAIATDAASAGAALRAGAYDVVAEPFDAERVQAALRRARERQELSRKLHTLQSQLNGHDEGVVPLRELERRAIEKALAASRGSVEKAARMLGMGRATLYRRLATMNPQRAAG